MWNTVLFDIDGTIFDTGEGITKSVQYALKKGFGIEVEDLSELRRFVGPPLTESFMDYAHLSYDEAQRAIEVYRERYAAAGIYETSIYPGFEDLLIHLKQEGFRIAVSSSKPEAFCRQLLESSHLLRYFDVVVGSNLDGTRVDKAEVIEEVFNRFGSAVRREESVLVGDRKYDMIGAKKAGISSIGVTYGFGSREELEREWPDCIVDTIEELRNVLIGQYRDGMKNRDPQAVYKAMNNDRLAHVNAAGNGQVRLYDYDGPAFHRIFRMASPFLIAVLVSGILGSVAYIMAERMAYTSGADLETVYMQMSMAATGVMDLILFGIMVLMARRDEAKRRFYHAEERILIPNRFGVRETVVLLCAVETVSYLSSLISSLLIPMSDTYEALMESMNAVPAWISFILVAFIAPLSEEMIFRGVIYRRARDYCNVYMAAALSGILFGIFHGNLSQGVPAAVLGFVFCLFYEHYGTIKANILCHILINIFGSISILTDNEIVLTILGLIMLTIAGAGFYCIYYIFKKEPKVNRV